MTQEVSNPFAVLDIGLVTRDGLHVLGIDQDDAEGVFQQGENRPPIDARTLHRHLRDAQAGEPVTQVAQAGGRGTEGADSFTHAGLFGSGSGFWFGEQATSDDGLLVDIESGTGGIENLHAHCILLCWLLY